MNHRRHVHLISRYLAPPTAARHHPYRDTTGIKGIPDDETQSYIACRQLQCVKVAGATGSPRSDANRECYCAANPPGAHMLRRKFASYIAASTISFSRLLLVM